MGAVAVSVAIVLVKYAKIDEIVAVVRIEFQSLLVGSGGTVPIETLTVLNADGIKLADPAERFVSDGRLGF